MISKSARMDSSGRLLCSFCSFQAFKYSATEYALIFALLGGAAFCGAATKLVSGGDSGTILTSAAVWMGDFWLLLGGQMQSQQALKQAVRTANDACANLSLDLMLDAMAALCSNALHACHKKRSNVRLHKSKPKLSQQHPAPTG